MTHIEQNESTTNNEVLYPALPQNALGEVPFALRVYHGPWIDCAGVRRPGATWYINE